MGNLTFLHACRLPHYLILALLVASVTASLNHQAIVNGATQPPDMGWLRPGVRAWYFIISITESTNSKPSSLRLAGVYTIKGLEGGNLVVREDYLTTDAEVTLPSHDIVVRNPAKEGPFWASPLTLAQLKTGDRVVWMGNEYIVTKRGMTSIGELMKYFEASPLPALVALYLSGRGREPTAKDPLSEEVKGLRRDVVIIEGSRMEQDGGRTYAAAAFDVVTGLLIAEKFKATSGKSAMTSYMTLAEINYDFLRHEAFPEPGGLHTGFTYSVIYTDMSTGYGYSVVAACIGRYRGVEFFTMQIILSPTYTILSDLIAMAYDEEGGEAYAMNLGNGQYDLGVPRGKVVRVGDHIPFYIPPEDLSKDAITVWGVTLTNNGEGSFTATSTPQTFGFTQLTFSEEGYAQSIGIYAVIAGTPINFQPVSPISVDAFQRSLQDYRSKLGGPVKPSPKPLISIITQTTQQTTSQGISNQQTGGGVWGGGNQGSAATPVIPYQPSQGGGNGGGTYWVLVGAGIAVCAIIALATALLLRRKHAAPPIPPPPPP